ncbi:MAG: hypothetical protein ACR2O4_09020 [Hyphomicrobiaceae bacterium]
MRILLCGILIVSVSFSVISWLNDGYDANLRDALVFNGWLLFAGMAFQLLMRLKTTHPEWLAGTSVFWNRLHIGVGCLLVLVFGMHTSWSMPDMFFEWVLWALFVLVAVSGIVGAWLNRAIPFRLDQGHERVAIAAIPEQQIRFARQAETLALASAQQLGSDAVSDLFAHHLHAFFEGPRNLVAHLRGSRRPLKQMLFQLQNVERDVSPPGDKILRELRALVEGKDRLDFQYAHEMALRAWLFVHVPAAYALVTLSLWHVAIVYAFTSGSR